MFSKKQQRLSISPEITESIFNDFLRWYNNENRTFLKNPDNSIKESTCVNIALLEPSGFIDDKGKARIEYLFGGKSPVQGTARRMKSLYSLMIVKYGQDVIQEFKTRCLESLITAYQLDSDLISNYDKTYNTFWMFPMFKRAFENTIFND